MSPYSLVLKCLIYKAIKETENCLIREVNLEHFFLKAHRNMHKFGFQIAFFKK